MLGIFRRGDDSVRVALVIGGALALLVIVGLSTAALVTGKKSSPTVSERMGPKKNYAALPPMSFSVGGGDSTVDLRVLLEVDPTVDPKVTDPYAPRIADRLADRFREIGADRLAGSEGAALVKGAVSAVVDREVRSLKVRDVLLERMVVR